MEIFFVKTIQENCHLSCHTRKFLYEFLQKISIGVLANIREKYIQENWHTRKLPYKSFAYRSTQRKMDIKKMQIDIILGTQIQHIQIANIKATERKIPTVGK